MGTKGGHLLWNKEAVKTVPHSTHEVLLSVCQSESVNVCVCKYVDFMIQVLLGLRSGGLCSLRSMCVTGLDYTCSE